MNDEKQILFDKDELGRTITRMAYEVIEKTTSAADLVLIGIRSRGVYLARRMARKVYEITGKDVPVGVLDVSSYRDDRNLDVFGQKALFFDISVSVNEQSVVLVDDVIFRGRTIRAAMEAVSRIVQPKRIMVAALVDREPRQLSIRADMFGEKLGAGD